MATTSVDHKPHENDEVDEELRTLSYHRALAYDALTRNSRKRADSYQKKKRNGPRQPRTYPPTSRSVSPASTLNKASRQDRVEAKEKRESPPIIWQPRKPAYMLPSRKSETNISNNTSFPGSEYRPHSTPPKQRQRPQTRYGPINQSSSQKKPSLEEVHGTFTRQSAKNDDVRSEFSGNVCPPIPQTTDSAIRSSVQPLHITEQLVQYYQNPRYDSSPGPVQGSYINSTSTHAPESVSRPPSIASTVSRGRRMSRARPSSSTSTTCSSYCPSTTSTKRLTRPPSPSRGAWISDHPQQEQPSFRERASHRFSKGLHLNLRRAGVEPESSFIVHSVVKKSTNYVPAPRVTPAASPSPPATPTTPTIPWEPPNTAVPFAMELHHINNMLGVSKSEEELDTEDRNIEDTVESDYMIYASQYIAKVEDRMRRIRQQQRSLADMRRAPESSKSSGSDKSLFLQDTRGTRPTSDSFFATEWSRQQAENLTAPLSLLNPFQLKPFDAELSQPGILSKAPEASPDDRIELPSQSRKSSDDSLVIAEALTKSPEQMSPVDTRTTEPHLLKRKRGMTALR